MTTPLIISVSGLRGEIGQTLVPEVVMRYAAAFSASVAADGPFVITRDGRRSGDVIADIIHGTLRALGRSTLDGGIAATPTTGVLVRQYNASGGIQISASHNPAEFNGLKLFSAEGRVVPKEFGENVLRAYRTSTTEQKWAGVDSLGTRTVIDDTTSVHLDSILQTVDVDAIRKKRFKVLLDSNCGAGSILGQKLLEALGCEFSVLGGFPDGLFEHTPEPTAENLVWVSHLAKEQGIDVVFCQDPDADRLAVIDEFGHYPGEEYTLALFAQNKFQKTIDYELDGDFHRPPIVINCATSRMTVDIAAACKYQTLRTAVGEANVVDAMLANSAIFGGEGNGGPIDPLVGYVRDSFVGMANILELMARSGKTVSQLVAEVPQWHIVKQKIQFPLQLVPLLMTKLAQYFSKERMDTRDGLRIERDDGWILVRGSNTEPIVRIIAESRNQASADAFCDEVRDAMRKYHLL